MQRTQPWGRVFLVWVVKGDGKGGGTCQTPKACPCGRAFAVRCSVEERGYEGRKQPKKHIPWTCFLGLEGLGCRRTWVAGVGGPRISNKI